MLRRARYHLQHTHLFATDLDAAIAFYANWFDDEVMWDGSYAGSRNVFMKIGTAPRVPKLRRTPRGQHDLGMGARCVCDRDHVFLSFRASVSSGPYPPGDCSPALCRGSE